LSVPRGATVALTSSRLPIRMAATKLTKIFLLLDHLNDLKDLLRLKMSLPIDAEWNGRYQEMTAAVLLPIML